MKNLNIAVFGNKVFTQILNELNLKKIRNDILSEALPVRV